MRKKIFYCCLGVFFFILGIRFLTDLTDPGYGVADYREFMENREKYEVLFFGNSHMRYSVYPMELWHDQGIVSYNLSIPAALLPATCWKLKEALHAANPKVVVIDCYELGDDTKIPTKEYFHIQTDSLPLTVNKIRMVCDLVEKPEERLEFIWDFAAYHERWQELSQTDFEAERDTTKGGGYSYRVVPPGEMAEKPKAAVDFTSVGTEYLCDMIEECQNRDIEVLLTYIPFPANEKEWQEALCMERIAEEYGISSINFLDLQVVDFASDCYDETSHLNGSGGRKVTRYLGQYIADHYDVEDHRGEMEYDDWDEDYRQYTKGKLEVMAQLESLNTTLVMLADQSFDCCVYVDGDAAVWQQNEMYLPLIENIAGGKTEKLAQAAARGSDYLLIVDNPGGGVYESVGEEALPEECSLGQLTYEKNDNGEKSLCLRDQTGKRTPEGRQEERAAVQVFVMDNQGDGTVWMKSFAVDEKMKVTGWQ